MGIFIVSEELKIGIFYRFGNGGVLVLCIRLESFGYKSKYFSGILLLSIRLTTKILNIALWLDGCI